MSSRDLMRGLSTETEEKQRLMIKTNYKLSFLIQRAQTSRFLDVGLEAALDGGLKTSSGYPIN